MQLMVTISSDNAEVEEMGARDAAALYLRDVADRLEGGGEALGPVRDGNGNTVGRYHLSE